MANYNWQGAPSYGYTTWTDPGAGAQMPANTSGYMQQPYYPSTSVPQQQPYSTAPTPYMVGYPETVQQSAPYQQYTMVQHYSSPIPQPTVPIAHPHQQYPSQEYPTEQYSCNRPVYRPQRNLTVVPVKNDSVKKGVRVDSARADKDYLDAVSNSSLESFDRQDSRSSRDRSPYRDRSYEREDYRNRERKWSLDRDSRDRQRDDRGRRRYSRSPRRDSSHNSDSGMRREKSPSPDSCSDIFKRLEAYKKKFNEIKSSDKPTDDHQKQDKERRISSNQVSGSKSKSRDSEARPQSKDSMPQYKDSRPQYQDSRPQYLDSRPQHKDSRPQHKDAKPQQKDTRPPQKEMRPPQNETKPSQKGASQKEIRPSQNERRPPQKETRPPQKEINKTPQKDTKLSSKTEQKETRPQQKQTAQTRTTRPQQNESKPQQKETKPPQKEAKPPETKEEFLSRKQLELNKKIDSQKAQVTAKRKASTEDTVTSANTSKKTKSDSEENVRTSVKDKTAGNKDQAKVNTNATDSLKKADSKSSSTSSPKKDSDNKFVIPKVPLRNTSSGNSPRKSNSPRAQNTVSPRSTRKSSRIIQQASRNPTVKTDSADSTTDRRRSDRVTDRSPGEGGRDSGGSSDHKKDAESKDGKRKLTDDKRNESHTDEKRRRYDNHASDSYSKTSDNSSKSDNKTKDFKEKNKASSKPNDKNISHKNDKQVSKKDNQSGRESDSKKHDDSSSHKDHSHSNKDSKTSSAAGKSRQVESATKKAVVSKVDRSEIEEVLGMVLDDDEKAETLKTDMITFDDFSDKSLPSGDHPQSEIDSKLKTVVNPVVGLQYVDELIKKQVTFKKSGNFNRYRCKLCIVICDGESLIGHVMGRKHRQSYLKRNWPTNVKDLCRYNIEKSMFAKLHGECSKIEKKFGRQKVRAMEIEDFVGLKKKDSSWQIMIPDEDRRIVSHQGLQVTTIENDGEDTKPQTSDLKNSSSDEKALDKSNISKPIDSKSQSSDKLKKTVSTGQSKSPASTSQSNNSVSTSQTSSTFSASQSKSKDVSDQSKSQEKQELQPTRTLEPHIQKSLSRAKQVSYKDGKHYVAFYKLIQNKLSVPILGLNYVVELAGYKEGSTAQYLCELCKTPLIDGPQAMFDHIQDQTHQEHYLIQFHGRLAKHFVQMKGEDIRKKIVTNQARVAFAKDGRGQLKYVNMSKPGKNPAEESKADENKAIVEEKPKHVSVPSTEIKVKLFELLEGLKDVPVVGLSYITEIQSRDPATKPRYQCSLCDNIHSTNFINAHLTGLTHRIKFLKTNYPLLHSKVGGDKQMVVKYVKEIEDRYGRESVWVKTLLTTSPNGMPVYSEPIFVKGPYEKKTPEELSPMKQLDQNKPEEKQTSSETTTQATPSDDASVSRGESSGTEFELLIEGLECTPFLGLQYITEIQHPYKIFPAKYECMLCHHIGNGTPLTTSNILNHISSRGHRLNFFRENHEHIYKEIISNKDRQQQTDALTQCTKEIDATIGRGAVSHLVSSDISYWEEEEKQRQKDEKEMEKKKNTAVIDLTQSLSETQPESVPEQTKPESSTVTPTTEEPIATASGTTTLVEIPKKKDLTLWLSETLQGASADHTSSSVLNPSYEDYYTLASTPIQYKALLKYLDGYKNRRDANILKEGFKYGFTIPFEGQRYSQYCRNLSSAQNKPNKVAEVLNKEIKAGRMAGPFDTTPFKNFIISAIGLVPKKSGGEERLIHNQTYPEGISLNFNKDYEFCSELYTCFDEAVRRVQDLGKSCKLFRMEIKNAFRLFPVTPKDFELLGICFNDQYYFDKSLPFGSEVSCQAVEIFSTFLEHAVKQNKSSCHLLHYLDVFLGSDSSTEKCKSLMDFFSSVMLELGVPIAEEKTEGPCEIIEFLGIVLDSNKMEARIPLQKIEEVIKNIKGISSKKRLMIKEVQSLIGSLNICFRAMPMGRPFCRRLMNAICMLSRPWRLSKPNYRIRINKEIKLGLDMWQSIFHGHNGILSFHDRFWVSNEDIQLFTNSAGETGLGFGAILKNRWCQGNWPAEWHALGITKDYTVLELFPIVVSLSIWGPELKNKKLIFFCDCQDIVHTLNTLTSRSERAMCLVRLLIRICIQHNIWIKAEHRPSSINIICSALSRFQNEKFRELVPLAASNPDPIPDELFELLSQNK